MCGALVIGGGDGCELVRYRCCVGLRRTLLFIMATTRRRPITQPPHSSGARLKGIRSLIIDPSQIPSAVDYAWEDQSRWLNSPYYTTGMHEDVHVPSAATDCTVIDRGNASPRFLRMSCYSVPAGAALAATSSVPIGFIFQPFADQQADEEPVPQVNYPEEMPPRCTKCAGYINPWVTFTASGQVWICNLCNERNQVPAAFFSPLDRMGRRTDNSQRPELNQGTVDFVVTSEPKYHATQPLPQLLPSFVPAPGTPMKSVQEPDTRPPAPMRALFLIDASSMAASSGTLRSICECIRHALYGPPPNEVSAPVSTPVVNPSTQIGFMTFDSTLHYWTLSSDGTPSMHIVSDISDVFVPVREGMFVDPAEARPCIEMLLDIIPRTFEATAVPHVAAGAALRGGLAALSRTGGQILHFQSSLCSYGPGFLIPRNESDLSGTAKEKGLFVPQDTMWSDLAEECAASGAGINVWVFPESFVDVATIGALTSTTGGELYFHPRYKSGRDEHVLRSEVGRVLSRMTGYNCSIRVRCSDGLHVSQFLSLIAQPTNETAAPGILSADTAISGLLEHTGQGSGPSGDLDDRGDVYIQAAVLYTSISGERKVRVCNLKLGRPSRMVGNVFKGADMDAGVTLLIKEAALLVTNKALADIRASLTHKFVDLLTAYRKYCAAAVQPDKLILPESYKLLPVLGNAILKTKVLKGGFVSSDTRSLSYHRTLSKGVASVLSGLYPRIISIHNLPDRVGIPDPTTGRLNLAYLTPASYVCMEANGAYLLDNGEVTILWLGSSLSPQILLDLFDVEDWDTLGSSISCLPHLSTRLSIQVRNLIAHEETRRGGRTVPFLLARQNMDAAEIEFGNMLVEDANNDGLSYADYMCHLHNLIVEQLNKPTGWNFFSE
ncbi:COPII coat Sec23p-Sfb3p heterodimer component [Tulasnella sp. JGI-2019a]|nr:COPII coat Sec23p-Sfb3p heterodimer component [Tulasnella sp. JGI-2019a]